MIPVAKCIFNIAVMPTMPVIARDTLLTIKRHLFEMFISNTNTFHMLVQSREESMLDSRRNLEQYDRKIKKGILSKIPLVKI